MARTGQSAAVALAVALAVQAAAAQDVRTERVSFARGASSAVVEGRISGREIVDHLLAARAGQIAIVAMETRHAGAYFNLIAPGETDVAFFVGSVSGERFEGALPATGDYRIRVYLVRSAARRGEAADYRLEIGVAGAGGATLRPEKTRQDGVARAGEKRLDVRGAIPSALSAGPPMRDGATGDARGLGATAAVLATRSDGETRAPSCLNGAFANGDAARRPPDAAMRDGHPGVVALGAEGDGGPDAVASDG